jgi:hypothetical protein
MSAATEFNIEAKLMMWQGRIAKFRNITTLGDACREMAQQTKSGDPFRELAAGRLLRAAANHIDASPQLYEPIVYGAFPEFAPDDDAIALNEDDNNELDAQIDRIDGKADVAAEVARLAKLSTVEFERERKSAAERLGVRASALDALVKADRSKEDTGGQGRAFGLAESKPWHEVVDGAALISDMMAAIKRYIVLPEGGAEIVSLWILHSHAFDCFGHSPRLAIQSPEKGCGKTTLLDFVAQVVARALPTSNATTSAIFRIVEASGPTLLIDEADTFLRENDELRGILNSGHRKGGAVIRTVGDDHEPRQFSTWAPCAIALIGRLPDTLEDRSIVCALRRRKPSERVESFRGDRADHLHVLARKAARWCEDHAAELTAADPDMGTLQNRTADNWRPIYAIADVAGGPWPARVRDIAAEADAARDEQSHRALMLADIRDCFTTKGIDRISSEDLVAHLVGLDNRGWCEFKGGRPLTKATLTRMLSGFGVVSTNVRMGGRVPKGYYANAFEDAFERYLPPLPPPQNATSLQAYSHNDCSTFQSATEGEGVALSKPLQAYSRSDCSDVAFSNPPEREIEL